MHKYMFIIIFIGIQHCSKLVSTSDEYRRLVVQNKFDRSFLVKCRWHVCLHLLCKKGVIIKRKLNIMRNTISVNPVLRPYSIS